MHDDETRLTLTEAEKDDLFADFMLRIAEMNKEETKINAAKNRRALLGMAQYYRDHASRENNKWMYDESGRFCFWGMYQAYLELRKVVPILVNAKQHGHVLEHYCPTKPLEEKDRDEATKIGSMLIDTMLQYLKDKKGE